MGRDCAAWNRSEIRILRRYYPRHGARFVADRTSRTIASVRCKAKRLGIALGRHRRVPWSPQEITQLRDYYPIMETGLLANWLGRSRCAVFNKATQLKLDKSSGLGRNSGRFHSGMRLTWPAGLNRRPGAAIGAEKFMSSRGYLMRKITSTGNAVRDWQKVHRLVWEDANGPVPDGHFVVFRDGDKTNVSIKNLVLLPAADAARRASELYSSYPKEVRMAMRALGKLKKAISEKS